MLRRLIPAALLFSVLLPADPPPYPNPDAIAALPGADIWYGHLAYELMYFWSSPGAQGSPVGAFPSTLCDDSTAVDYRNPCAEVRRNAWLMQPTRYIVPQSRQMYAYGVAYHITGDPWFLDMMKAGVDYFRANFRDTRNGGLFTQQNLTTGAWGPKMEQRNPQELAYGLLGIGFYYYLTRDPEVLPDILSVRDHILGRYNQTGVLQWALEDFGTTKASSRQLTATLDQMNAYMVLLTPILPEPYQSEWKENLRWLSYTMIETFYSPEQNLMFLQANTPDDLDITKSATDFGHTIKAMWMIRLAGLITGDRQLVRFAETNGPKVLERAYLAEWGTWASGVKAGGELDLNKSWWIFCELDQFAATLGMDRFDTVKYLPQTYDYWFSKFVDRPSGEVWSNVDGITHERLANDMPKAWPWKNGYHSMEHAMVAYISTRQFRGEPVRLFFNFQQMPGRDQIAPYIFRGSLRGIESFSDRRHGALQAITFEDVQ